MSGAAVSEALRAPPARAALAIGGGLLLAHLLFLALGALGEVLSDALAFAPGRRGAGVFGALQTLVTLLAYVAVHGDWGHLGVNLVGLAVCAVGLHDRIENRRFLAVFAIAAALGALTDFAVYGSQTVLIGASAGVSGLIGVWIRDATERAGPLIFLAGAWLALTYVVGAHWGVTTGAVAWEAHVGGYVFGLIAGPAFTAARRDDD